MDGKVDLTTLICCTEDVLAGFRPPHTPIWGGLEPKCWIFFLGAGNFWIIWGDLAPLGGPESLSNNLGANMNRVENFHSQSR